MTPSRDHFPPQQYRSRHKLSARVPPVFHNPLSPVCLVPQIGYADSPGLLLTELKCTNHEQRQTL